MSSKIIQTLRKKILHEDDFYSLNNILSTEAEYMAVIGKRSNGKTFAVKEFCLTDFIDYGNRFIYMRREKVDLSPNDIEAYFQDPNFDIVKVTKMRYTTITAWGGMIYAAHESDGKIDKKDVCGRAVSLASAKHYKSQYFPQYKNLIFEEWLSDEGYLPNEPNRLMHFVSTVARLDKIRVFLIGNTIDQDCIYYREWQLVNIPYQQQGTIDVYAIDCVDEKGKPEIDENGNAIVINVAVEMCDKTKTKGKMAIGDVNQSINGGRWESRAQPHLPDNYDNYDVHYEITFVNNLLSYKIALLTHKTDDTSAPLLYCYPTRKIKTKRVITKDFSPNRYVSQYLYPITTGDKVVIDLIRKKRIVYSDNLTGTQLSRLLPQLIKGGEIS